MADAVDTKPNIEVTTRAILERPTGITPPHTLEKEYLIHNTREILQETSAVAAAEAIQPKGYSEDRFKISAQKNLGEKSERTVRGRTQNLREVAETDAKRANTFLKEGLAGLTEPERKVIRGQLEASFRRLWPEANVFLAGMSTTDRADFIDKILHDAAYFGIVNELLGSYTDPDKEGHKIPEALEKQRDEIEAKLKENLRKQAEEKRKEVDAQNKLEEEFGFNKRTGKKGKYYDELSTLRADKDKDRQTKEKKQRERVDLVRIRDENKDLWDKVARGGLKVSDPDAVKNGWEKAAQDVSDIEKEILTLEQNEARLETLETMVKGYQETIETADKEKTTLEDAKLDLDTQKASVATKIALEALEVNDDEHGYIHNLESLFDQAGVKYFEERLAKADDAQIEAQKKIAKEKGDPIEEAVSKALQTRWSSSERGFLGRETHTLKKDEINSDFRLLIDNNPSALMTRLFPGKTLTKDQQREVLVGLIRKKIEVGGLSTGEARQIFDSTWGPGLIDEAIEKNEKFKGTLQHLKDANGFKGTSAEFIQKHKVALGGALLLIALGIIGPVAASTWAGSTVKFLATR